MCVVRCGVTCVPLLGAMGVLQKNTTTLVVSKVTQPLCTLFELHTDHSAATSHRSQPRPGWAAPETKYFTALLYTLCAGACTRGEGLVDAREAEGTRRELAVLFANLQRLETDVTINQSTQSKLLTAQN